MAATAAGQPPGEVVQSTQALPSLPSLDFASILKPSASTAPILKPLSYHHGEPKAFWTKEEFQRLIIKENLQFAIVGKFSHGRLDMKELRRLIPSQCDIKGDCKIGYVDYRHVLIRLTLLEDYVNLLSKPAVYIKFKTKEFPMRTFKWTPWFDPEEETSIAIAWISLPSLPPHLFAKESIFTIASAVGKPLKVDMATENQTRPSCARVKVEVDLLGNFPQRFQINCIDSDTNEVMSKWIKIKYDYMPSYCKTCRIQGHKEVECRVIHPELAEKKETEAAVDEQGATDKSDAVSRQQTTCTTGHDPIVNSVNPAEFKQVRNSKKFPNKKTYAWTATKDNRAYQPDQTQGNQIVVHKVQEKETHVIPSKNQFSALQVVDEDEQTQNTTFNKGAVVLVEYQGPVIHEKEAAHEDGHEDGASVVKSFKEGNNAANISSKAATSTKEWVTKTFSMQSETAKDGAAPQPTVVTEKLEQLISTVEAAAEDHLGMTNTSATLTPAHNGTLIPTKQLEILCKDPSQLLKQSLQVSRLREDLNTAGSKDLISMGDSKFANDKAAALLSDFFGIEVEQPTGHSNKQPVHTQCITPINKSPWNVNAPSFVPSDLQQQGLSSGGTGGAHKSANSKKITNVPTDVELIERMDLYDTRGLLERQNSTPKYLPQNVPIIPPGFFDGDSEYEDDDEESTAYNHLAQAREGGLSPRAEQSNKPKMVKKERAPLERRRVQPDRSSRSKPYRGSHK